MPFHNGVAWAVGQRPEPVTGVGGGGGEGVEPRCTSREPGSETQIRSGCFWVTLAQFGSSWPLLELELHRSVCRPAHST